MASRNAAKGAFDGCVSFDAAVEGEYALLLEATAAANLVLPVVGSITNASSHRCPPTPLWHKSSNTKVAWWRVESMGFLYIHCEVGKEHRSMV